MSRRGCASTGNEADIRRRSYGVTRVYSQQCGYVLHDAESAKSSMQTVFRAVRSSLIDEQAHIGR